MINTYFQIQGSPANLDNQAVGVNLDSVTELHPARVGAGPGLSKAASEDSARDLGLHHLWMQQILMCHHDTKLISLLPL